MHVWDVIMTVQCTARLKDRTYVIYFGVSNYCFKTTVLLFHFDGFRWFSISMVLLRIREAAQPMTGIVGFKYRASNSCKEV